ncbi:hypothetical protein CISG_04016 [Coccidioides immitis RMSCC 3703]|uniref:Uncharacterized protein n=1 Tax=Coccidioides immitis RMSCC 3703 TaxID=454286 RepID=A0A0J8TK59_COCIT|nr:hypothetical protein CISG_04016 [Coccidioides immitis RMSCC 3703]
MSSTFYILFPDNGRPRRNRATNLSFSTHQAFLIRCFIVEAIIWGLPFAYGLFQDFYTTHEPFKSDPSGIAAIGTTALGMMYLGSPICFMAMQKMAILENLEYSYWFYYYNRRISYIFLRN